MPNDYVRIKQGMRENEITLLAHLRKNRVTDTMFFGRSWRNALDRLICRNRVEYRDGVYRVRRGAGPVTGSVK